MVNRICYSFGFGIMPKPRNERNLENKPMLPCSPKNPDSRPIIIAFGDSLTEGAGVDPAQNYPSKLQAKIDGAGYEYKVVNAGISGETSAQGLDRIQAVVNLHPKIVIVELGANDGLLGMPVEATRKNLIVIIELLQSSGAKIILAGMRVPPNYGLQHSNAFRDMFNEIAEQCRIPLIPFFLESVARRPELNQDDGKHPTAEGYDIIVEHVWKALQPLL
jgi:acyl-CoA thioesterase I